MNSFYKSLVIVSLTLILTSHAKAETVYQLLSGQWVESAGPDPFEDGRPVQLWVPESTLLYSFKKSTKVKTSSNWKYREATTHNGIPIHFKARDNRETYKFKKLWDSNNQPKVKRFFFTQSILCLGETNAIKFRGENCDSGNAPSGEGWHFEIIKHPDEDLRETHSLIKGYLDENILKEFDLKKAYLKIQIVKNDLEVLEKKGKIVRLDRPHPLVSFHFVGSSYLQCNSEKKLNITETNVKKAYASIQSEAGFNFFSWLKATVEVGLSAENVSQESETTTITISAKKASVFRSWGVMIDRTNQSRAEIPFYIEKAFKCKPDQGTNQPGKKITSVEFKFWNSEDDTNIPYKFPDSNKYILMDNPEIYSSMNRPIFMSVNSAQLQAKIVERISQDFPEFSYNQSLFVYSQLNNSCSGTRRDSCLAYAFRTP